MSDSPAPPAKKMRLNEHNPECLANLPLERRVLLGVVIPKLEGIAKARGERIFLYGMPEGTWADLLVRFGDATGAGAVGAKWISVHLKTTSCISESPEASYANGIQMLYRFSDVRGYAGALVLCVCEAEADTRLWMFNGTWLDIGYNRKHLKISYNQKIKDVNPIKGRCPDLATTWEAVFDALRTKYDQAIQAVERAAQPPSDEGRPLFPLALTSLTDAEAKLAFKDNRAIEHAGICEWVRCAHGGFAPEETNFDPAKRAHLPTKEMRDHPLRYRLLVDGDVFAYADAQNAKSDVLLYRKAEDFANEWKLQFKTATKKPNHRGWHVNLGSAAGKEEKHDGSGRSVYKYKSQFTYEDNHFYVVVVCHPSTGAVPGVTLVWECSKDWMKQHGLLVDEYGLDPETQGFNVHAEADTHNSHGCTPRSKTAYASKWTKAMTEPGIQRMAYAA